MIQETIHEFCVVAEYEDGGKYVMAGPKCYCKIVNGKRAEKYPWEEREVFREG